MSVNLTIAFDRYGIRGGPVLCYERHRLDWQDYDAFDRIKAEAIPLPEGVQWYEDEGVQERKEDPYGNALTWMPTHTLARHLATAPLRGWDSAVHALLKALPLETRAVLWWS